MPALLLAGALLSSSDAGADDSARHDAKGTADAPLRPLAVPGKPGKPEVIPFVIPNQGSAGAYFLVKWTHPTGGAANYYFVRSNHNLDGGGAYTGTEGRFTKIDSITLNRSHAMRVVGTDDQTLANAGPWSDATTLNSSSATVAASSITSSGATLTVSNLPATWWYKGDQTGAQCTKVANGTSSATITGLDAGTEYTYNVYYRDTCTEDSDKAAHWDVKATFTTETTPAKPTNLTATRGNASVTLSWTAGSNGGSAVTKWQYAQKSDSNYGDWTDVCVTSGDSTCPSKTSHTVSSLTNGTAYKFKMRAVNSVGNGAESDESSSVTPAAKPSKPSAPTLTSGNTQLGVSWSAPAHNGSAITDYDVQYSTDGSTWTEWNASDTSTTTSATITGLTNGTAYQVQVRATNGVDDSDWSDSATEKSGLPGKPTITAVIPTGGCIIVRWDAPADNGGSALTGYTVSDPGSGVEEDVVSENIRETKWGNNNCTLLDSLPYGMRVKATNANGNGPWSDEVSQRPAKPDLTASSIGYATATLSISNHANAPWWYQGSQSGATCTKVAKGTASADVSGLDGSTDYTYTAYYDDDCGSSSKHDDVAFTTTTSPTLAGGSVTHNSATLTISNYSGNWYYKYTSPTGGTCSTNAVSTTTKDVTGLDSNTSYTYKAYSDSSCNTELAAASAFLTKPGKPTKPTATASAGSGKLTLSSSVTGSGAITGWKYAKSTDNYASWSDISSTAKSLSYAVTNLTNGTAYQFKVQAVNATGTGPASDASDAATPAAKPSKPSAPTLTRGDKQIAVSWSAPANNGASISDYDVRYSSDGGANWTEWNSSDTSTTASATITGLTNGTAYQVQVRAANARGDGPWSDSATATPATTPAAPTNLTATRGDKQVKLSWTAGDSGGSAITGWKYAKKTTGGYGSYQTLTTSGTGPITATVSGLPNGTAHKFKVRAVNAVGDGAESAESASVTPLDETLTFSNETHNSATLTIGNWTGNWYYKANAAPDNTCKGPVATAAKSLTGLSGNTNYTYTAYSNSGCSTSLQSASLLTKPGKPGKPTVTSGAGSGKLTITASVSGSGTLTGWKYAKSSDNYASWSNISSTEKSLSYTVTGLTDGTNYQFKVRAVNATGDGVASDASTAVAPVDETLAVSNLTHNSATLTIGNHSGDWYYKYTSPTTGSCSSNAVSGKTVNLSNLDSNTNYTYKAYSNNGCSTELVSAALLTKPGKASKPTVTAGVGSGKLTLSASSVSGNGTLTGWKYAQKTTGSYGSWQDIDSNANPLSHVVTGLTNGTSYQFKVKAVNATGEGAASDESDATTPIAPTLKVDTSTATAKMTISNHTGDWYYQGDTGPHSASCQGPVSGTNVNLSGLTPGVAYTYTAYSDSGCTDEIGEDTFTAPGQDPLGGNNPGSINPGGTGGSGVIGGITYDDDEMEAAIRPNPQSVTVVEGSAATYTVALLRRPKFEVIVSLASDNAGVTVSPASLTFTTANWHLAQTVTLSALADDDLADGSAVITHTAGGKLIKYSGYLDVAAALPVAVSDNDVATVRPAAASEPAPAAGQSAAEGESGAATADPGASAVSDPAPGSIVLSAAAATVAEGYTATYTVALSRQPGADVTISLASGDDGIVTVSPASLTFTPANWNAAQTATLAAVEDDDLLDAAADIIHRAASADAGYAGVVATLTVTADDTTVFRQLIAAAGKGSPTATPVPPAATPTPIPAPTPVATATPAPAVRIAPTPSGPGASSQPGASPAGQSDGRFMANLPMLWVIVAAGAVALAVVSGAIWWIAAARQRRYG